MSAIPYSKPLSVDEFLERPEREDGYFEELIDGEVIVSPCVKKPHNDVVRRIERLLLPLEQQGFVVHGEVACRLSNYTLPNTDACAIRKERWDAVADDDFIREAPALAVEVASPSNRKLRQKAAQYLEHGAEQVWVIYPKSRTVLVMTPEQDREAREGEYLEFGELRINVTDIFAR